jgi:hypothetical protein
MAIVRKEEETMSKIPLHSWRWLAIALAGPVVEGAILGLRGGPRAVMILALGLPAILAAVTALTTPMLYVGGAVLGGGLPLGEVVSGTGRALHALGLALLGVAPLTLLLAATLPSDEVAPVQAVVLMVVALAVGLHRLAGELGQRQERRAGLFSLIFFGYTLVATVLGARLFFALVCAGGRLS